MDNNFYKFAFHSLGWELGTINAASQTRSPCRAGASEPHSYPAQLPSLRVELISSDVNWVTNPPEVRLNVGVVGTLTPNQVRLLEEFIAEEFIAKETGQRFTLIFQVCQIEEIKRGNDEQSPTATE